MLDNPLIRRADGGYDMDFNHLETLLQQGAKAMILCSPHNPVSRLWRREELEKLLALLGRYGVPLIADEIHADFVYAPEKFVSCLKLEAPRMVTLCAASKTFNLAGLRRASLICRDAETRQLIQSQMDRAGVRRRAATFLPWKPPAPPTSTGDEWLDALLGYLDGNRRLLAELVREHLPRAVAHPHGGHVPGLAGPAGLWSWQRNPDGARPPGGGCLHRRHLPLARRPGTASCASISAAPPAMWRRASCG